MPTPGTKVPILFSLGRPRFRYAEIVAVRITLEDGGVTVFRYATMAHLRGDSLVIYEWNAATNDFDELLTFPAMSFIKAEVMRHAVVTEVILGRAEVHDSTGEP